MSRSAVTFEGLSADEIMAMPPTDLNALVFCEKPLVVQIGSSEILGKFSLRDDCIVIELAHIDGGGEGVLPAIGALANRIAQQREISNIEWQVHAVHCGKPNLKLRRMLDRRGFEVLTLDGVGDIYHQIQPVA